MKQSGNRQAKLFYLVGASGSGKDSLLRSFRKRPLDSGLPIVVAHRYITREGNRDEDSVFLSDDEYRLREQGNLFSLSWQANGLRYGIGIEIEQWLSSGFSVLVNGSRGYMAQAKLKFEHQFHSILVSVPEEELRNRLYLRARECEQDIEQRLIRHRSFTDSVHCDSDLPNIDKIDSVVEHLNAIITSATEADSDIHQISSEDT